MSNKLQLNRYLIARRVTQVGILFLYIMASLYGWKILSGNLSASLILDTVPLSDPFAIVQILLSGSLVAFDAFIGAGIIFLLYALIAGRAFCSWICPVNMVSDLAFWLRTKLHIAQKLEEPNISRDTRYWIVALTLILSPIVGVGAFEFISPVSILHRGIVFGIGVGWTVILIIFLFDLVVLKRGFCGHLCPLGGFYSLISRYSLIRVKHDHEKCTHCMKCFHVCPEEQVLPMIGEWSSAITSGECTNCGRCIDVCHDDSLNFGLRTTETISKTIIEKEV